MLEQLKNELLENGFTVKTYEWGLFFFKGDSADFTVTYKESIELTKHLGGLDGTSKVNKKYKTLKGIMTYLLKESA